MYNVNTDKINTILTYIDGELLPALSMIMKTEEEDFISHTISCFAAERIMHLFIEGMTDIGNLLIDGFIMRDPGSYEDIVDIMEDNQVYTLEQAEAFKEIIFLRKGLVIHYTENIHRQLYRTYHKQTAVIHQYPTIIREYLKRELW